MVMARQFLHSTLGAVAALASGTPGWTAPAEAAVRLCRSEIHAVGEDAESETEARRKALRAWASKAGIHGQSFIRWQLAEKRGVFCTKMADGLHSCTAMGQPCTIRQVPTSPPPKPGTRGNPMDV